MPVHLKSRVIRWRPLWGDERLGHLFVCRRHHHADPAPGECRLRFGYVVGELANSPVVSYRYPVDGTAGIPS